MNKRKKRKKIIIIIVSVILLLSLCIGVIVQLKKNNGNKRDINYGDIGGGILLNSADVNYSSSDLASKNVENAIGEIYQAIEDGCLAGYERGTQSGGTYVCNKRTSDLDQTAVFSSSAVYYDNTYSGLTSTTVDDAIDELADLVPDCKVRYTKQNATSNSYECKKTITITAFSQNVGEGDPIEQGPSQVTVSGLTTGDSIQSITLTQSTTSITNNGTITPSNAVIVDSNNNDVTSTYTINYVNGLLIVNSYARCVPPSNVSISSTGVVTWDSSNTALAYEISVNGSTYSVGTSGVNYYSTLIAAAGTRTVYVRSVCDGTIYNTPSVNATASINVYTVTLTKGTGVSSVTGAGRYFEGTTVTLGATVSTGYTWSKWAESNTIITVSTTNAYSATITSNWDYTAVAAASTYTVNYYNGNGTSTTGSTLLGTSTCTYGTACTLKTYAAQLGGIFPYSSADTNHDSNGWYFYGWTTSATGLTRTYTDGASINPTTYSATINLYSLGRRKYRFNRGIAPTSCTIVYQEWNSRNTGSSYRTSISIPAGTSLSSSSNGSWTFLGYIGGSNSASNADVHFAASIAGTTYNPEVTAAKTGYMRSKYKRTLTISYNKNGGSGTTMDSSTLVQYYNSGIGADDGSSNSGETLGAHSITLKSCTYTYSNYAFSKWAAGSSSGTQYAAGASYTALGSTVKSTTLSTTMYATWTNCCPNGGTRIGSYCYTGQTSMTQTECTNHGYYWMSSSCYRSKYHQNTLCNS